MSAQDMALADQLGVAGFVLSLVAFLFSVLTWVLAWRLSRRQIRFSMRGYTTSRDELRDGQTYIVLYGTLMNGSQFPVNISDIDTVLDRERISFSHDSLQLYEWIVRRQIGPTPEESHHFIWSTPLPVYLPTFGAEDVLLCVRCPSEWLPPATKKMRIEFKTTRRVGRQTLRFLPDLFTNNDSFFEKHNLTSKRKWQIRPD